MGGMGGTTRHGVLGTLGGNGSNDGSNNGSTWSPDQGSPGGDSSKALRAASVDHRAPRNGRGNGSGDGKNEGPWQQVRDDSTGRSYWYHTVTRETSWDRPPGVGGGVVLGGEGEKYIRLRSERL